MFLKTIHKKELAQKETYEIKGLWLLAYIFSFISFILTLMQILKFPYMVVVI